MHSIAPREDSRPGGDGRLWVALTLFAWLVFGAILLAMGREAICSCGTIKLWHGVVQSPENSQHIADWYSFSHVIHGFLFYGLAWLLTRRLGARWHDRRIWLFFALLVEGGWELLENSPIIIDRYRAVTIAYGYEGDSVLNSMSDMAFMALGFLVAARIPVLVTVVLAIVFELFTAWMIRDNLTLNVLMLVAPVEAVKEWQDAG